MAASLIFSAPALALGAVFFVAEAFRLRTFNQGRRP